MSQSVLFESVKIGDLERRIRILENEVRELKEYLMIHEQLLREIRSLLGDVDG